MNPAVLKQWCLDTAAAAKTAGHIYPDYAAAEAALESSYGTSKLARQGHNLFGQKYRKGCPYPSLDLPTQEFENGEWKPEIAHWISYPDFTACFTDRMATLQRLRDAYVHYEAALTADSGNKYVIEVSKTWSTDPQRAYKVLDIYAEFLQGVAA